MEPDYTLYEIENLKFGDHLCCLYSTEKDHEALLTPFLKQGLENHEKVIYIVDSNTSPVVKNYLKSDNIDVESYLKSRQFVILTVKDTYLKDGYFDPDKMIKLLKSETETALKNGYSGLRVTGEMTWVLKELPGSERLIEYESKLNIYFPYSRCLAICQYDIRKFSPDIILKILETHPIIVIGTEFFQNFYYIPPEPYLGKNPKEKILHHWINNIKDRKLAEQALNEQEHQLRERIKELNCLYGISKLLEYPDISIEEIIEGTINLIPPAFQFPEIICSRILYNSMEYKTDSFDNSPYNLSYEVIVNQQIMKIDVFYLRNKPFLKEEKIFLKEIGDRLKLIIEEKIGEIKLKESEKEYRNAFNRSEFFKELLSHDIKNILQVLFLCTSQGLDNLNNEEYLGECFKRIIGQIEKIDKLVENVNKFSKLEEIELKLEPIDLYEVLKKSVNFVQRSSLDKTIKIQIKSTEKKYLIKANEFLIEVFDNLLNNAARHNDNSEIEILIRISSESLFGTDYYKLEFIDNGKGIPDERKKDIFQRFTGKNRLMSGLGSGLSLVNKIISDYDGKIWIEDRVKGDYSKGSNFIMLVPKLVKNL